MATLSVGVPAYNHGRFLRATLESLVDQEELFDEILVSDNYSVDDTAEVIAAFVREHPGRVRVVRPAERLGAGAHWNFVVEQMTGEWVSLVSSDDLALPNFARCVRAAARRVPGAALVRGGWREINGEGVVLGERRLDSVRGVTAPARALYEQRFGPKASFAAFALRREVWERVGGFPAEVTIVGDWAMWLLAGALGSSVTTGEVIASYRTGHQGELSRSRHALQMRECETIYREILPRATELAGLGRPGWIARASRTRLRELMMRTSREFGPGERGELVEAFRSWAAWAGEEKLFRRYEQGEELSGLELSRRVRTLARKVLGAVGR